MPTIITRGAASAKGFGFAGASVSRSWRYWRIFINAVSPSSDGVAALARIWLYDKTGNIKRAPSAAFSSSNWSGQPAGIVNETTTPSAATDSWAASSSALPQWITVDLGSIYECGVLVMYPQYGSNYYLRAPTDFFLQGSNDNSSWKTILRKSGVSWGLSTAKFITF